MLEYKAFFLTKTTLISVSLEMTEENIMKCPTCGAELKGTEKYCTECGTVLETRTQNPAVSAATVLNGQKTEYPAYPELE